MKKTTSAATCSNQNDELKKLREALTKGLSVNPIKVVRTPINTHELKGQIETDGFALSLLEDTMPNWIPVWLQRKLKNSLRGYNEEAALWIAESLMDCYHGYALTTTGIKHIDDLLWSLYHEILFTARTEGIDIANHR